MNDHEKIGRILSQSTNFEDLLFDSLGAQGKGLHEKINSVEEYIPKNFIKKLRRVASIRNKAVHSKQHNIDFDEFEVFCNNLYEDLTNILERRTTSNSYYFDEFNNNSSSLYHSNPSQNSSDPNESEINRSNSIFKIPIKFFLMTIVFVIILTIYYLSSSPSKQDLIEQKRNIESQIQNIKDSIKSQNATIESIQKTIESKELSYDFFEQAGSTIGIYDSEEVENLKRELNSEMDSLDELTNKRNELIDQLTTLEDAVLLNEK